MVMHACVCDFLQELELERYSQGEAREEQLNAELSTVRCLNVSLLECVSSLHSGLAEATLIAKCTESELTGRCADKDTVLGVLMCTWVYVHVQALICCVQISVALL